MTEFTEGSGQEASSRWDSAGVVTPEAVRLDFETAGLGSRSAAAMIDMAIRFVFLLLLSLFGGILDGVGGGALPGWVGTTVLIFSIFGIVVLYPLLFEALWGKTPGKAALGLRVVTSEGAPINFRQASIRAAIGLFEIFTFSGTIAAIAMVVTAKSQRLGDLAAGTMVLRQRQAAPKPQAVRFAAPVGAEEFTLTLDVSHMTNDEYVAVRSFLLRSANLTVQARNALSEDLGRRLAIRLRAQPPTTMTAETFLVCVAAAYQRRFATT